MNAIVSAELDRVVNELPWYGPSVKEVLSGVDQTIISRRIGKAHTASEILLHMIAWTEEVTSRLEGKMAKEPERGDWPDPSAISWDELIDMFDHAHATLQNAIARFPADQWDVKVQYEGDDDPVSTFRQTVNGLIQHHVYHLGQISILNKQLTTSELP